MARSCEYMLKMFLTSMKAYNIPRVECDKYKNQVKDNITLLGADCVSN